jgi:DNA polymerase-3 subunit alpha
MISKIHTHYSLLQSIIKPDKLATLASDYKYESLCLTDYATVSGAVKFVKECKRSKIKPILGCEIPLAEGGTVTVLCKNHTGWKKLLRIVSILNEVKPPGIPEDELLPLIATDFLCIDGYIGSRFFFKIVNDQHCIYNAQTYKQAGECLHREWEKIANEHVSKWFNAIGPSLFLEENTSDSDTFPASELVSNCAIKIAAVFDAKVIPGQAVYYLKPDEAIDHRLIICSKLKATLTNIEQKLSITDNIQYQKFFMGNDYALPKENNQDIVSNLCEPYNILSDPRLPHFKCPDDISQIEYVKQLCREGWKKVLIPDGVVAGKKERDIYRDRVLEELAIIEDADLAGYFLIVWDYINEFRSNRGRLLSPARGSAAGSLVSYLLGITLIDPIKYNLLFSRFFNKARKGSLPDIDTDFPPDCRDDVVEYLKEKYGDEKVCQMVTFGRLQGRSALKEVLRVNNSCSFDEMNIITSKLPQEALISDKLEEMDHPSVIRWALENDADSLSDYCIETDDKLTGDYAREFAQAMRIEGTFKSQGKHAAGVIVASEDIREICPIVQATKGDDGIAGLEMNDLADAGGVKFDILGLSLLKKCEQTCEDINNVLP